MSCNQQIVSRNNHKEIRRLARISRWSARDAHQVMELCESSGISVRKFCLRHGLGYKRMMKWRERFRNEAKAGEFIEVKVKETNQPSAKTHVDVILWNGRMVRVSPGYDAGFLTELLTVLEN